MEALDGCRVSYQPYIHPVTGKNAFNYVLKCPLHSNCFKSRADTPAFRTAYGDIEPLAYLHAWAPIPWPTPGGKKTHRGENTKREDVHRYAADNVDGLQELFSRLPRG